MERVKELAALFTRRQKRALEFCIPMCNLRMPMSILSELILSIILIVFVTIYIILCRGIKLTTRGPCPPWLSKDKKVTIRHVTQSSLHLCYYVF